MRAPDGDWQIFIEHEPGKFEPKKVELVAEKVRGKSLEALRKAQNM